jgi:hypothetical protein
VGRWGGPRLPPPLLPGALGREERKKRLEEVPRGVATHKAAPPPAPRASGHPRAPATWPSPPRCTAPDKALPFPSPFLPPPPPTAGPARVLSRGGHDGRNVSD